MKNKSLSNWNFIWRIIVIVFSLFMTIICIMDWFIWQDDLTDFSDKALSAEGVVVDKNYVLMSGDGNRYKTDDVVKFVDINGDTIQFVDHTTLDFGVQIGDAVPVLYMPDDPEYAKIDLNESETNDQMISWLFVILAVVFGLITIFTSRKLIRMLRKRNAQSNTA